MPTTRQVGLLTVSAAICLAAAYSLAVVYATIPTLQLTALVAVLGVSGVLAWVGYTDLTARPAPPEASPASALDDLQAETISPDTVSFSRSRFSRIIDAEIGEGTIVRDHVNLYKCKIGKNCKIESFVYIEEGVTVGDDCKIKPHVFIPTGVAIEDGVFIGPNVTFTNDKYPHARGEWTLLETVVARGASIGANSVILPCVRIGRDAMIGAGSVVTADVPDGAIVAGNPARSLTR